MKLGMRGQVGRETPEGVRVQGLLLRPPGGCWAVKRRCLPAPNLSSRYDPWRHILTVTGWGGEKGLCLLEASAQSQQEDSGVTSHQTRVGRAAEEDSQEMGMAVSGLQGA